MSVFCCPVCRQPLSVVERKYSCEAGHSFDIARQGYVNLLLAHHKKSKSPGDSKEMLLSRRNFLENGYYQPLVRLLSSTIKSLVPEENDQLKMLDIGCGEGYFLSQITEELSAFESLSVESFGTDIAKEAVAMAGKRRNGINFAVASNFKLPVLDNSVDVILRMFAPGDDKEVVRCLKENGIFVAVTPGPRHLFSLKEMVYREPRLHPVKIKPIDGLKVIDESALNQRFCVDNPEDLKALLQMTPYYWNGDRELKAKLDSLQSLETEMDFVVTVYHK